MITVTLLLALGIFPVVSVIKMLLPFRPTPAGTLLGVLLLSAVAVVPFASDLREGVLLAAGVYGLSTLLHGLHKLLQAVGDDRRVATLRGSLRR